MIESQLCIRALPRVCVMAMCVASFPWSLVNAKELEEVVVTAQKRSQSIQDVPISMIAFSRDDLESLGLKDAQDVFSSAPNLGSIMQQDVQHNFFIRGVGTMDFHLNTISAVGVYQDEVSVNSPFGSAFSLFDMERVEVLRGPQNTLFGRNTTGGAVNYITRRPDVREGLNGYLRATYGRFDQVDLEGAVGFPFGRDAAVRVSLLHNDRDGAFNNLTYNAKTFDRQRQAARVQLLWLPTENIDVLFKAHGGINRSSGVPVHSVGLLDPADLSRPCPVPLERLMFENNPNCATAAGTVPPRGGFNDVVSGTPGRDDVSVWGLSARFDWHVFDSMTLTSVTAFDSTEVEHLDDVDGVPEVLFEFHQDGKNKQWSQDLRLASAEDQSLRWMAGFFYFFEDSNYSTAVHRAPEPVPPAPVPPSGPGTFTIMPSTIVEQDDEVFSGYFQVDYDILHSLTGTVGFRYTHETKDGVNAASVRVGLQPRGISAAKHIDSAVIRSSPLLFATPEDNLDATFKEWGARFGLEYRWNEDILLYGSASRGVKAGGFSLAALQALTGRGAQPVDTEVLWAYEIGSKLSLLGNSMQVNVAGFYYDWDNLQSFQTLFEPTVGFGVPQLANIPKSSALGGELEIVWMPAEGWFLKSGVGLLDAEIDDAGLVSSVSDGNTLPLSPDITFNGLVRKEFRLGAGLAALQTDFSYRDDVTYGLDNSPELGEGGFWTLNARATYALDRYEITVWGENLTNTEFCAFKTTVRGLSDTTKCTPNIGEPTYGVTVKLKFE